ncbi:MAG: hypothetical protein E6H93_04525 [Chloroflexi bacterium]|nr:MAG: hypothetical protein E6H93_04525 [Chloroflexota bacterium]
MVGGKLSDDLERAVSALHDPTRRAILLDFYMTGAERTVDDVAKAARVHRTVAFSHLERLAALGYLSTSQLRGKSGKPAKLYRLTARPIELSYPMRRFELLAALLATSLKEFGNKGIQVARETGRHYGAGLVNRPATSVQDAFGQIAELGSDYSLEPNDLVVARNCIFREACRQNPEVVSQVHAGLLEGALQQAGLNCQVQPKECHGAGCSFHVVGSSVEALQPAS